MTIASVIMMSVGASIVNSMGVVPMTETSATSPGRGGHMTLAITIMLRKVKKQGLSTEEIKDLNTLVDAKINDIIGKYKKKDIYTIYEFSNIPSVSSLAEKAVIWMLAASLAWDQTLGNATV
eukprot:2544810-Ditylum_brightwellii.AAC.1